MTEELKENKQSWIWEAGLILAAPALSFLASLVSHSVDFASIFVFYVPIPLALIIGFRAAKRYVKSTPAKVFVGLLISGFLFIAMVILGVFGCSFGGAAVKFQ